MPILLFIFALAGTSASAQTVLNQKKGQVLVKVRSDEIGFYEVGEEYNLSEEEEESEEYDYDEEGEESEEFEPIVQKVVVKRVKKRLITFGCIPSCKIQLERGTRVEISYVDAPTPPELNKKLESFYSLEFLQGIPLRSSYLGFEEAHRVYGLGGRSGMMQELAINKGWGGSSGPKLLLGLGWYSHVIEAIDQTAVGRIEAKYSSNGVTLNIGMIFDANESFGLALYYKKRVFKEDQYSFKSELDEFKTGPSKARRSFVDAVTLGIYYRLFTKMRLSLLIDDELFLANTSLLANPFSFGDRTGVGGISMGVGLDL